MIDRIMHRDEIELRAVPDVAEAPQVAADGPLSFDAFYGEHFDRIHTALFLLTGNRHEAEEIAQESFLRVSSDGITSSYSRPRSGTATGRR